MQRILAIFAENKLTVGIMITGLFLMGLGLTKMMRESQGDRVELITPSEELLQNQTTGATIVVDVAGAVASPSVYRLDSGARVAEALAAAGGVTTEADSNWVAQRLNQAEVVKDGTKIFIPFIEDTEGNPEPAARDQGGSVSGIERVNVNTATEAELDALWGIGTARAQEIIKNRPYATVAELQVKAGIPENVLQKNEGKIGVY